MFETYHGVTGATHQANYTRLKSQEFRLISLSSYGDHVNPLYAAVWVHRDGPPWEGFHGLSAPDFQTKSDRLTKQGYVNTLLSAVGTSSASAVFCGVFEKRENPAKNFMSLIGLRDGEETDSKSFQWWNKWCHKKNLTLRCASIYGSFNGPLYAAIWETNADATHWLAKTHDTEEEYVKWFDACIQLPYRPAFVTSSQHGKYLSIFKNDDVGENWVSKQGLNGTQYQAEVERLKSQELYPICVQGGGPSTSPCYTAIFAEQDIPTPKVFTIQGETVAELEHIDDVMSTFMKRHGVRAGQITISKDGVTKLERAYTYASPSYPVTHPSTFFRLASASKAFMCAAITEAMNANLLTPSTPVFPLLEISSPALDSQTPSPFIDTITIQHLIDHAGGWKKADSGFDAIGACREIAIALNLRSPVTKWDVARYMYGEPLQFEPGTEDFRSIGRTSYCNFGYLLLGLVIEKISGMSFIDFLKERVMAPLGITDVAVGKTRRDELRPDEVSYDGPGLGLSAIDFRSDLLTPYVYGGEGFIMEAKDSCGGLIATATAVVTLIQRYAVWGIGERAAGHARAGGMAGTRSYARSRDDGVDFVYIFNTRYFPLENVDKALGRLSGEIMALLDATPIFS